MDARCFMEGSEAGGCVQRLLQSLCERKTLFLDRWHAVHRGRMSKVQQFAGFVSALAEVLLGLGGILAAKTRITAH